MKRSLKIVSTCLLGIGCAIVALRIFKNSKKRKNEKITSSKSDEKVVKDVVNIEKGDETRKKVNIERDPDNLVVRLYESMDKEPTMTGENFWDRSLIKESAFLDSDKVIHVSQSVTRFKGNVLDFYFEIPEDTYSESPNYPEIKDFIFRFKNATEYLIKTVVGCDKNLKPIRRLVGFYVISFKVKGKDRKYQQIIEIPEEHYEYNSSNGLYEYVKEIYLDLCRGKRPNIDVHFNDPRISDDDEVYDLSLIHILLMYKISFPIGKDENNGEVWKEKALRCIEYFTEELQIEKRSARSRIPCSIEYRNLIFHSRDYDLPGEEFNMMRYYTTNPDEESDENFRRRKLVTKPLEYEYIEEEQ